MTQLVSPQQPDWMVVYVTYHIHEGQIIVGRLQFEDIPAMLYQEPGADAIGVRIGRMGEIKVLVRPENYAAALRILSPEEPATLDSDTDQVIFDEDNDANE